MTTGQTPALTTDRDRLRVAALLVGLSEAEADTLVAAVTAGTIQVLADAEPEAYQILSSNGPSQPLLAWAAAHSAADTITLFWDGLRWHACFADQRSQDELFLEGDETYAGAVVALLDAAGRFGSSGILPGADPETLYQQLVERGCIIHLPSPYTLLALEEAWNGVQATL